MAPDEVVKLRSWVGETQWGQGERQHLEHLQAGAGHRKSKDVLSDFEWVVLRQAFDVCGVVEEPFALGLN